MNPIIKRIKEEQKALAIKIRKLKDQRKSSENGYVHGLWFDKDSYRHIHIAFCELKGTQREVIEKPRLYNEPNEERIKNLKDQWIDEIEKYAVEMAQHEDVCASA